MDSARKTRNDLIKSPWYRFTSIALSVVLVLAALVVLIQSVGLRRRMYREGISDQLTQALNLARNITNGSQLVTNLRIASIVALTSSTVTLILYTLQLINQIEYEVVYASCSSNDLRPSFKSALFAAIAAIISYGVSVAAFALYQIRLPPFEDTEGVCEVLYDYERCGSALFNTRKFALVPVLLLGFLLPLAIFNVYMVWKYRKHAKAKEAKRQARIEEERLRTLPVVDYGTGANDTSNQPARTGMEVHRS